MKGLSKSTKKISLPSILAVDASHPRFSQEASIAWCGAADFPGCDYDLWLRNEHNENTGYKR